MVKGPQPARAGWDDGWYVVPWEVTWRDLDGMEHVNNAVYFTYFEWARTKYWLELREASSPADRRNLDFIVVRAECDYRRQLSLCDAIDIRVRVGEMRNSSFDFLSEVRVRATGELAAVGKVVMVLFSWESNRPVPISREMRDAVMRFQGGEAS